MATQTQKASKIGMRQGRYSEWKKKIANGNYEAMLKGECFRVMESENLTIKIIEAESE